MTGFMMVTVPLLVDVVAVRVSDTEAIAVFEIVDGAPIAKGVRTSLLLVLMRIQDCAIHEPIFRASSILGNESLAVMIAMQIDTVAKY